MTEYIVLLIDNLETAAVAGYIDPDIRKMDYDHELQGNYLVLGFPAPGRTSLVKPLLFNKNFTLFDHVEHGTEIPLKRYIKKPRVEEDPLRKTPYIQKEA